MDTEWFAVDADGHVARFDSGEDGAVPNAAAIGFSPGDASFDVELLRVACFAERIAADPPNDLGAAQGNGRIVALLEEGYRNAPTLDERFEPIGPVFLSREPISPEETRRLSSLPHVRVFDLVRVLEVFEEEPLDGVFSFERNHGDDPGLYQRSNDPERPLLLDTLPRAIRAEVASLRLPVHFGDTKDLHLADHLANQDAMYWGEDWALRWPSRPPPPNVSAPPAPAPSTRSSWLWLAIALIALSVLVALVAR